MKSILVVGLGGFLGANMRYWVCDWVTRRWGDTFPFGTMLVNVIGSFLIGVLVISLADRFALDPDLRRLVITGFLGSFTTFSSYMVEVIQLVNGQTNAHHGWVYLGVSILLGLAAVLLGIYIGGFLAPQTPAEVALH